ncbi:MAG TPA: DUF4097 family beta strand repeat-containing protein [Pyrinomonadaceae bacterium]|nr:DUF4097 family beta strand repeat-containing protein [Pyrinomonadaceae bacterium]
MRNMTRLAATLCFILSAFVAQAAAQEFQKTYRLGAGGSINIRNVSGDVNVKGYDGDAVIVNGIKEGRDRDKVEIEDNSGANNVSIGVRYARDCNCDASVRFEVQVPRNTRYDFDKISTASGNITMTALTGDMIVHTASGDVTISDVSGKINAATASGEMKVQNVRGTVTARSASGNVDVQIARLEGTGNMEFASASGDVRVSAPADLDGNVEMASATGDVRTDFPLQVEKREYGPGERATGRLGSGARNLRISSASGNVSLLRSGANF